MGRALGCCLVFLCFLIHLTDAADWNILNQKAHNGLKISLKNYCESWRMNVELHNIRDFRVGLEECTEYIGKYVKSTQYKVDSERATEECLVYLSTSCKMAKMLGFLTLMIPCFLQFLSTRIIYTALEEWMRMGKAPALDYSPRLFNDLKSRGIQIILISARREHLRSDTIDNLVKVGYHGWTSLVLRDPADELVSVAKYKSEVRKKLIGNGYRIWGILGDQYSSIEGNPSGIRAFKQIQCTMLPNLSTATALLVSHFILVKGCTSA